MARKKKKAKNRSAPQQREHGLQKGTPDHETGTQPVQDVNNQYVQEESSQPDQDAHGKADQDVENQADLEAKIEKLEQRIEYLEQSNRVYLDALELAKSFGDFQESINELGEPQLILSETKARAWKLIEFDAQAIFLMQEENSNLRLADCDPEDMNDMVLEEFEMLIEDGIIAMAINDNRPIMLSSSTKEYQLLVHVMATCSRVRGMFVGLVKSTEAEIPEVLLSLLSILLNSSANALESYELYGVIREQKNQLEELLRQKTGELNGLQDEIDIRVQKKLEQMQSELDKAQEKNSDSNMALLWFKDYCLLNTSSSKKKS